jgi:5-methylcytosine-specific restriction endonuclease McrA
MRTSGGLFTREEWEAKLDQTGWVCSVCERPLAPETARCGHAIPKAQGGTDALDNRIPLCQPCQCRRAARLPRPSRRVPEESSENSLAA